MILDINWLSVLVTTASSIFVGFLWFGPVFGRVWMKSMGVDMPTTITPEMKKQMNKSYMLVACGALLMNLTLLYSIVFTGAYIQISGVGLGLQVAFWNWLGFVAPVTIGSVLWEGRPWRFWLITSGYWLFVLLVNGMILSVWR